MCPKLGRIGNKKGEVRVLGRTSLMTAHLLFLSTSIISIHQIKDSPFETSNVLRLGIYSEFVIIVHNIKHLHRKCIDAPKNENVSQLGTHFHFIPCVSNKC